MFAAEAWKILWRAAAAAVVLFFSFAWVSAAPAGNKKTDIKNVILVHQSSTVFGKSELYICPDAARFLARNGDIVIATRAPEWTLMVYSRSRGLAMVRKADLMKSGQLGLIAGGVTINRGVEHPHKDLMFGLKYADIVSKAEKSDKPSVDSPIFQEREKKIYLDTTLKMAVLDNVSPRVLDFLYWIYSTGRFRGLPLECRTRCSDGSVQTAFCTTAIEKTSKPASFFDYPTGFKRTDDLMLVLVQEGFADTLEDLWGASPHKGK